MAQDRDKVKVYEIDLARGVLKADNHDDHMDMMDALEKLGRLPEYRIRQLQQEAESVNTPLAPKGESVKNTGELVPNTATQSLPLVELLDKFFLLKQVKPATVTSYKNVIAEFTAFCKSKCHIAAIMVSDVTRYREYLATKNSPRTIDNKMIVLKSLMNFAIDNGYLTGKNPVVAKNLQTKKQKMKEGHAIFEADEIKVYFNTERFKQEKTDDPDYYWCVILEIFTGCRVGELTALQKNQFKKSDSGVNYIQIRDSKTVAGIREIPIPNEVFEQGFDKFIENKNSTDFIFKYKDRTGKGAGNAVGKKFTYQIKAEKIHRPKLVFHSMRKFLNDLFMKNKVMYEMRCQYFGHETDDVNITIYADKFNVDDLFEGTNEARKKVMALIGY